MIIDLIENMADNPEFNNEESMKLTIKLIDDILKSKDKFTAEETKALVKGINGAILYMGDTCNKTSDLAKTLKENTAPYINKLSNGYLNTLGANEETTDPLVA